MQAAILDRCNDGRIVIVETKGQEDVDVKPKMLRLKQWCADVSAQSGGAGYDFVYVDEAPFQQHKPKSFAELLSAFRDFK